MRNQFLFFDIDGTLKDFRSKEVPASASEAIRKAQKNGCLCFIASGRPRFLIHEEYGFEPNGLIFASGAGFELNGRVVLSRVFPDHLIRELVRMAEQCHVGYNLQCFDRGFASRSFRQDFDAIRQNSELKGYLDENFLMVGQQPIDQYKNEPVYKIDVHYYKDSARSAFLSFLKGKVEYAATISMNPSFTEGAELSPYDVNKGTGVLMVVTHYHGDMDNTWAFGDSMNDYEMIRTVRHGVAMANGVEEVKKAAEYVTDCPSEDGIAHALAHYHLI
jgi:Cof subfamily protein (haloacid dehalogenase superfamily)